MSTSTVSNGSTYTVIVQAELNEDNIKFHGYEPGATATLVETVLSDTPQHAAEEAETRVLGAHDSYAQADAIAVFANEQTNLLDN